MQTSCNIPDVKERGSEVRKTTLTKREEQVAALVCEGLSNKVIARRLQVSEGTVKAHLHAIFSKLGIESRFRLVVAAHERSLGHSCTSSSAMLSPIL